MTIEAGTLEELTHVLQEHGMVLLSDVHFVRAPYRYHHRWTCTLE